jgi:flagellar motor switch protein FliM
MAMAERFLSQDEVDALLQGVTGESASPREDAPATGIRPYNLATQERIVRGRMPTLEIINERFARLLRIGLFNFMRRTAEVSLGPIRVSKYSEFSRNLVVPTNLNLVQVKPLRGTALVVFDPDLVFLVIDSLFGGDGRFHTRVEGRDFSQTEQRLIQRMLDMVFEHWRKAWEPVFPIEPEYVRSEMHTQFANIATPNEVVVSTTLSVEFGPVGGNMHLCLPYAMIEPIRDVLCSSLQGEQVDVDRRWVRLMSQQVQAAEVELVADLGTAQLSLRDILNLQVGDVVPMGIEPTVTATVDGVPVMACTYGIHNRQYALRVERMVGQAQDALSEPRTQPPAAPVSSPQVAALGEQA